MNMFRFYIGGHGWTDWETETVKHGISAAHTAPERMTELRRQYPNAAITIEREGDSRAPNPIKQCRFQIKEVGDIVRYSRLINEDEKDARLAEIKALYPDAEIAEVKF